MSTSKRSGMHTRKFIYHFQHDAFDFMFQWLLGSQTGGGSEIGESFYAATRIKDGDPESWVSEWSALAERVEARAEKALAKDHRISAREAYLRAYSYHRIPVVFMSPLHDSRYRDYLQHARTCFRKAMSLFDTPVEYVSIPFEGKQLPSYFYQPDGRDCKRKTLIMIGGGDTFVEDLFYYIVPAGLRRGYNVLIVDLPGQGSLPFDGLPMRPDTEAPMKAVVDYVLSRPQVDHERLAVFGISGGGYLVPRAVTREKRIKACVACSIILDFYQHWAKLTKIEKLANLEKKAIFRLLLKAQKRKAAAALKLIDTYLWRWGVENVSDLLAVSRKFTFDPAKIDCPSLIVVGENEYQWPWSRHCQDEALEKIDNPKKDLVITLENEGAEGHAIGTNLSLMSQIVFDWLDEVFA